MVPTRYYREYKIQLIDTLCKLGPGFIAVEEPESFIGAEYSEGFQEEWLDYYGTEFIDPASSAEARYMSSKLMTRLWMTMIDSIGEYMNEHYPDVKLVVATHSTANYTHWNIISAVNAFTSSQYVDGIIGQTWSDTVNSAVPYAGTSQTRLFEAAFSEYATYADSMQEGQTVFTLTDAKADDPSRPGKTTAICGRRPWSPNSCSRTFTTSRNVCGLPAALLSRRTIIARCSFPPPLTLWGRSAVWSPPCMRVHQGSTTAWAIA